MSAALDTRTFKDVEEEARDKILSLNDINVSRHTQENGPPAQWRETSIPFTVVQDASNLSHLLFHAWIQDSPNTGLSLGAEVGEEQQVAVSARMKVQFSYRLRSGQQIPDGRQGTEAAHDIVRVMMQPWNFDPDNGVGCVDLLLVNAMTVSLTLDGQWLFVEQDYIVEFALDNSAPTQI